MLSRNAFYVTLILLLTVGMSAFGQGRNETLTEKSKCFNGKIEIDVVHWSSESSKGSISFNLPSSARNPRIFIVGPGTSRQDKTKFSDLKPGAYTVFISDENNCTTRIDKIEIKEVQ